MIVNSEIKEHRIQSFMFKRKKTSRAVQISNTVKGRETYETNIDGILQLKLIME